MAVVHVDELDEYIKALDIEDDTVFYPERILHQLFSSISTPSCRHSQRYGPFIENGGLELRTILLHCLRPEVSDQFSNPDGKISIDRSISLLGGDLQSHGRAIYLHIVYLPDNKVYWYIGQAYNLSFRVNAQHRNFRYRRDNPSLHNYAMDRSISDRFVVLATLKRATSRPDFVMNLLEMWCCLLFRSLPLNALEEWIQGEEEFYLNVPSLNVALPLDNGDDKASKRAINWLKDARDPLARGYYTDVQSGRLRPRPSIRRPASLAAPKSTNTTILDYILGSEILWGMAMGASTTLGAFLIHRRLLKPLWQSFERK